MDTPTKLDCLIEEAISQMAFDQYSSLQNGSRQRQYFLKKYAEQQNLSDKMWHDWVKAQELPEEYPL